jgi:hypothetical protein
MSGAVKITARGYRAVCRLRNLSSIAGKVALTNVLTPDSLRYIATHVSLGEDIAHGE